MRCRCVTWSLAILCLVPALTHAQALGQAVTLAWDPAPEAGVAGYVVYVGTSPLNYSERFDAGAATSFVYRNGLAGLRYYFAVAAYGASRIEGPRSSEISTIVAAPTDGGSGLPTGGTSSGLLLQAPMVGGSRVTLAWSPIGALSVLEYILEAGSSSGRSDLYNGSVGGQTSVSATLADGTYFVRVRARTSAATSAVSNEVRFSIGSGGCTSPPLTPTILTGVIDNGVATITWTPALGATGYLVQAGSTSALSDLFHGEVGDSPVLTVAVGANFSAHVRVIAVNACGQSAASEEVLVP